MIARLVTADKNSLIFKTRWWVAVALGCVAGAFLYGQDIENALWPTLSDVRVHSVQLNGRHLSWSVSFCKLQNRRLLNANFFMIPALAKEGVAVSVLNDNSGTPAGRTTYAPGCVQSSLSTILPMDALQGDEVVGKLWYETRHGFWSLPQDFGTVIIPETVSAVQRRLTD